MTLPLGPITAKDLMAVGDRGSVPAVFLSNTIPCLAVSRASSWFSAVHTSFGPRFPYGCLLGLPSKKPRRIKVPKLFEMALSMAASFKSPPFTAPSVYFPRNDPQFKSNPAQLKHVANHLVMIKMVCFTDTREFNLNSESHCEQSVACNHLPI